MVVRARVCKKHLLDNLPVLTQYTNWCIVPFKEGRKKGCSYDCLKEAQYQIQQEGEV